MMGMTNISLQLDESLVTEIQEWADQPDLSAYVNQALRQQLARDRLLRLLHQMEAGSELANPQVQAEILSLWQQDRPENTPLSEEKIWQQLEDLGHKISEEWEGDLPPTQILSNMRR